MLVNNIGKNTVNQYYSKTDHLEIYCIAMVSHNFYSHVATILILAKFLAVLHPWHKLAYFEVQGWEEDWIDTAYDIICEEYNHLYASSRFDSDSCKDKRECV